MLYIFHVDTGTTVTFDMKLALESVARLKEAIERECGVAALQQVLLVSGGESLEPNARVCSYSAGTDTNPIYLFSKASIESHQPPTPSIDYGSDVDLQDQIDASLAMPATYQTVVARAQLAQQCCALAREQTRICERLVHDQHLQQQGWAAVVANLEDITQMFQSRADLLQQSFTHYLAERQQHIELLDNFSSDLGILSKIPILPALRAQADGSLSPEDKDQDVETDDEVPSLLKWISAKDNRSSLEQVAEQCSRGLEQFDERVMETLKSEVNTAVEAANKQDMKEIKGLGERLFGLEQLMFETKRLVQEQGDLAQAFLQNQNRASNLGDASILPDLCASHRRQLMVMLQNHNQLRDIRRRCTKAKEELSVNLYHRLKWIMYVENKMMEVDGKLVMYHESLKRLRRHLEVLQQIHLAPQMYMSAVAEVVRRRTFSQAFLVWASNLACQLLTVHSEELARRRDFQSRFDGHFLNTLFPGLEDSPPPFATQAPSVFDGGLPKLTSDDMESLREQLPDLALTVSAPDLNSITQFFLSKSLTEGSAEESKDKEGRRMRDETDKEQERRRAPMLGDRYGFESETDTEEFEKIGQGPVDLKPSSFDSGKQQQRKQSEVGASQSVSLSSSTNASPLNSKIIDKITDPSAFNDSNRSSSSSEPGSFHFPSFSLSERPSQLSPLTECAENGENNLTNRSSHRNQSQNGPNTSNNPNSLNSLNHPLGCGGQQSGSGGSSPSTGVMAADFTGTEFYMDESLPSSLSEHPADDHHQAIVSLLQENLGNTRNEAERLRCLMRSVKSSAGEALTALRQELAVLREDTRADKDGMSELTQGIRQALELHSRECERSLREREQELTVDHELEMADLKKLIQARDEEVRTLKRTVQEKEMEFAENETLTNVLRQKLEADRAELIALQPRVRLLEEMLDRVRLDKEMALKETQEASHAEISSLANTLCHCRDRIRELEESLNTARSEQPRLVKEATDKMRKEYKVELEGIRSRFKLMAASTMERSPSDSSLEKIERPDVIELINHEAIVAQIKEDMKTEKAAAIRAAIDKERSDCAVKLDHELRLARQRNDAERQIWFNEAMRRVVEEKERQVDMLRARETALSEECDRYRETIRRLTDSESMVRQTLSEKVESLEADKVRLEANLANDRKMLEQREDQVGNLEAERDKLREELNEERLKMSQGGPELEETLKVLEAENERLESIKTGTDSRLQKLEAEKDKLKAELDIHRKNDEAEVSESKKVRLEAKGDPAELTRRLKDLEAANKMLSAELRSLRESKESEVEALVADKVHLEVELVKERSRRGFGGDPPIISQSVTAESRDKDMSASVAVVPESSSRDAATSPEPNRRDASAIHMRDKLTLSTTKLVQQGRVCIANCNPGDAVLVLWDAQHRNYTVLQESPILYFLHSDCVDALDLRPNADGTPKRMYATAEVIDKDYCHARKPENRYRVPQGTKFYRVRVKPLQKEIQMGATTKVQQQSTH